MQNIREELYSLAAAAQQLHAYERQITLESVALVGVLESRNAAVNFFMSSTSFAAYIGLTPGQYWKRAQAARVIRFYPEALAMVQAGETHVSHLALISARITPANAAILLAGIKNKSKREVESFVSRITNDGRLLDKEPEIELRLKLTMSQSELLDKARDVLAHGGHVPSLPDIIVKALGDLLEKRDPVRKAKRAAERREKAVASIPGTGNGQPLPDRSRESALPGSMPNQIIAVIKHDDTIPGYGGEETWENKFLEHIPREKGVAEAPENASRERLSPGESRTARRPAVPAVIRHQVWLRDGLQCSWTHPHGSRCQETQMLEMDHKIPWCRGGPR